MGFDCAVEALLQWGTISGEPVRAVAAHLLGGHTLPEDRLRPRLYAEWNGGSAIRTGGTGFRARAIRCFRLPYRRDLTSHFCTGSELTSLIFVR